MSGNGLDRRAFLKGAQMTALVGAAASHASLAAAAPAAEHAFLHNGKFDFDTPYSRVGTDSIKWDSQIRQYNEPHLIAGMGVADMDFRCAPAITSALKERLEHEVWGYLDTPQSFLDGIVSWNKRRYGIEIDPKLMGITTGVHPGLIAAMKTFSPPGSKVLLLTPTYDGFYGDLSFCNVTPEESLMKLSNGVYSIDFEDLERRISRDTNTLILCNPQNPTGNCWTREDLTRVGEICLRRRVVVLADEIHCDFVNSGHKYTPFSTLENRDIVNNSITFKAASKSFGLAAMKCAWYFTTNPSYFAGVQANNRADLTTLGMIANRAAYTGGEDWLNQLVAYIDGNHEFAHSFITANIPLIKLPKAQATYLTWIDITGVIEKIGAKELAAEATRKQPAGTSPVSPETIVAQFFVKNARVQLNPGPGYGKGGSGHMRMNIATSRKTLELALNSMANALKRA